MRSYRGEREFLGAIGQSFSLTAQNFGKVFLALLSYIGFSDIRGGSLWVRASCGGSDVVCVLPLLYLALTGEEGVSHA
jgi:hypothetical protein